MIVIPFGYGINEEKAGEINLDVDAYASFCIPINNDIIYNILPPSYKNSYVDENATFYYSFKNANDIFITSFDHKYSLDPNIKKGIMFDLSNNVLAHCSYNISKEFYSEVQWTTSGGTANILVLSDCEKPCNIVKYSPSASDVPGREPKLYFDPNVPLTRYIITRTYVGAS